MIKLFSRPAMRSNPRSWLALYFRGHWVADVGILPEWHE